ncbi:cobalamin-binding protein [Alteromonas sp. ASW11-36]|uniref:Cobalamin-binding protein n=1 Tax=Alteromonas arenosi TaxID=3055817 RepID=A0ABT7T044_9ALTE|nr:cobalamin-binding protein [Alteromonas sp. ASW11-36]MDM7861800.1 cobalamin-binding protein [Alteromonas sp. ASW11-36]
MPRLKFAVALMISSLLPSCAIAQSTPQRIVTLAPHLTEWVYLLNAESSLVAVSAYSNFPAAAQSLPVVADANGVNFKKLLALEPDLVLVWSGGNKPQDISRLESMGIALFISLPRQLDDISKEIVRLGEHLQQREKALDSAHQFDQRLARLRSTYAKQPSLSVFYYSWTKPLMSIGANAWGNQALAVCGAETLFADSPTDYPEVRMAEVLKRQPRAVISLLAEPLAEQRAFWSPHRTVLHAPLLLVDADKIHRFTPRILDAIEPLCEQLHTIRLASTPHS